jgi:hypothetical protein
MDVEKQIVTTQTAGVANPCFNKNIAVTKEYFFIYSWVVADPF